jgi:DNA-binding beta-propeller fold protein YncE
MVGVVVTLVSQNDSQVPLPPAFSATSFTFSAGSTVSSPPSFTLTAPPVSAGLQISFVASVGNFTAPAFTVFAFQPAPAAVLFGPPDGTGAVALGLSDGSAVASPQASSGSMLRPSCMAMARDGHRVLFMDGGGRVLRQWDRRSQTLSSKVGNATGPATAQDGCAQNNASTATFHRAAAIAYDAGNNYLYVAEGGINTVRQIATFASLVRTVAGSAGVAGFQDGAAALFAAPSALALYTNLTSNQSLLFVADAGNAAVRSVAIPLDPSAAGPFLVSTAVGAPSRAGVAGGGTGGVNGTARLAAPAGLALDPGANFLYITDAAANALLVLDINANVVTLLLQPVLSAALASPTALAVDALGHAYVALNGGTAIVQGQRCTAAGWKGAACASAQRAPPAPRLTSSCCVGRVGLGGWMGCMRRCVARGVRAASVPRLAHAGVVCGGAGRRRRRGLLGRPGDRVAVHAGHRAAARPVARPAAHHGQRRQRDARHDAGARRHWVGPPAGQRVGDRGQLLARRCPAAAGQCAVVRRVPAHVVVAVHHDARPAALHQRGARCARPCVVRAVQLRRVRQPGGEPADAGDDGAAGRV